MDPFNVAGDSACAISSFLINQYAYSVTIIIIIYIYVLVLIILYTYYSKYKLYSTHNHIGQQYVHLHYSKHILTKCLWFGLTCYIFEELVFILKLIAKK